MMSDRTLRRLPGRAAIGLALALALGGCANDGDPTQQPLTDEDQIRSLMDGDEDVGGYFDLDGMSAEPSDVLGAPEPGGLAMAPIDPLLKWRRLRHPVSREISIEMSEGLATVSRVWTYEGVLALLGVEQGSEAANRIEKPLVDRAERHAVFLRMESPGLARHPHDGWRLESISPLEVESRTGGALPTVAITRMEVAAQGQEPWVLEESAIHTPILMEDLPFVSEGAEVTVTIETTGAPAVAFLHARTHRHNVAHAGHVRMRERMIEGPEGTFSLTFTAPEHRGRFHLAADLLTESSLFESDPAVGPYDSNLWGVAFQVGE